MTTLHRRLLLLVVVAALFAGVVPASASTITIEMESLEEGDRFRPSNPIRRPGSIFRWHNSSGTEHSATRSQIVSWNFRVDPGETSPARTLKYAGTYRYVCVFHAAMDGALRIRPALAPSNDGSGSYVLTLGSEAPPGDFVFDVQRRLGTGEWTNWRMGLDGRRTVFMRRSYDRHSFRARLRNPGSAASAWSPAVSLPPVG